MTQSLDPWLAMGPSSYQADGGAVILFPARQIGEDGGLRIAKRERPFQRGAKLDHTGASADQFEIEAVFHPDISEPGLGDTPPLWPDRLEDLIAAFKGGATATLHLPWKRNLRVKALQWRRRAVADEYRGGEVLSVTFVEDNEDALDREAFERVAVKAGAARLAADAQFDAEATGVWDGSIEDVTELAAELVGLMNAPGEYADQIIHAAKRVRRACDLVLTKTAATLPGGSESPDAVLRAKLLELKDAAAGAAGEAQAAKPKTRTVRFRQPRDIFSIAAELGQNARELISINSALEDPSYIPAGTAVVVFA